MKSKLFILLACLSRAALADEPLPLFDTAKIEMPPLSLADSSKKENQDPFFREGGPWYQTGSPTFGAKKKSESHVAVTPPDLDSKMIITPQSSVDSKMLIIPDGRKK